LLEPEAQTIVNQLRARKAYTEGIRTEFTQVMAAGMGTPAAALALQARVVRLSVKVDQEVRSMAAAAQRSAPIVWRRKSALEWLALAVVTQTVVRQRLRAVAAKVTEGQAAWKTAEASEAHQKQIRQLVDEGAQPPPAAAALGVRLAGAVPGVGPLKLSLTAMDMATVAARPPTAAPASELTIRRPLLPALVRSMMPGYGWGLGRQRPRQLATMHLLSRMVGR
jgi:hypothetical protein